jgi:integrase
MRGTIQATTYGAYRSQIEKHILPRLGELPMRELNKERIQGFTAELLAGGELAVGSIRSVFKMLRNALNEAVEWGIMEKNPCDRVRLPREEHGHANAFTRDEQGKIEAEIARSDDKRDLGVLILLYTGIRLGELCGLKWEQVDLTERTINIVSAIKRVPNYDKTTERTAVKEVKPKTTNSRRTIFIPYFLCDTFQTLKAESKSEFVVFMQSGKYVEPRTMQFVYKRLLERAGVQYRKLHSTRHTCATRALEVGVDVKTVSENLGHASPTITLAFYAHSLDEQKREAASRMNSLFENKNRSIF